MALAGVMTKFKIDELSGVDRPAQSGARATIMKRDSGAEPGEADPGRDDKGVAMSNAIKKALGLADTATDTEVETAIIKLAKGELNEAAANLAKAQGELKVAKAKAAMTDAEKALMAGKDDDAICKFMDLSADQRAVEIEKAAKGDETVVIEGRTISKRAVGEDMFAVMKAQAARIDASAAEIKKAREETAMAGFTKRASEDFSHLAGTTDERAAVLKFLDGAPAEVKASAEAILKAAEGHAKFAFSRAGSGGGGNGPTAGAENAEAKLTKLATEYEKAHASTPGMTFAKAYDAVAQANPQLYEEVINPSAD